ncbi:MAG: hypothetical protein ACJAT1_001832 [Marivirga sp.]|jgi:hypothetical protein
MSVVIRFFIVSILLFLVSCTDEKKTIKSVNSGTSEDFEALITLKEATRLEIEIDEFTPFRTYNMQYVNANDTAILIWENRPLNALEFYDMASKKLVKRIRLEKSGPLGIEGDLRGFEYISDDSIIVTNGRRYEFYLVNGKGASYKKYAVFPEDEEDISVPIVYDYRPLMVEYPYVYAVCKPDKDYNKPGWWDGDLLLKLNMETEGYQYILKGPEEYYDKVHGAFFSHHSMTKNDKEQIVISYPIDSYLEVFDMEKNTREWHYAGSKYFHDIPDWTMPDSNEDERFYIESNSYREILYDPWRQLYYRFAYRKVDFYDHQNRRVNWDYKIPSIIILNQDFTKIGECDLPKNTYYTRNTFVSPEGLYISINHNENKNADENKLSFQLFKPTYK